MNMFIVTNIMASTYVYLVVRKTEDALYFNTFNISEILSDVVPISWFGKAHHIPDTVVSSLSPTAAWHRPML